MSIDTGFDPTRPAADAPPSSSLKEDPVPHTDVSLADEPAEEGAPIEGPSHTQPAEGARDAMDDLAPPDGTAAIDEGDGAASTAGFDTAAVLEKVFAADEKVREVVKKNPMRALGVAALAGFLIGRVVSRI